MNISKLYFRTLLTSFVVLASAIVLLLYGNLGHSKLVEHASYDVEEPTPLDLQYQKLEGKSLKLQNAITRQNTLAENQRNAHEHQVLQFMEEISRLQRQLAQADIVITQTREQLAETKQITLQRTQELILAKAQQRAQVTALTSAEKEIHVLVENLDKEKQQIRAMWAESSQNALAMEEMLNQLNEKKGALVRSKRALATSDKALLVKSRELTVSQGEMNDMDRQIQGLNQKYAIYSE
jgi:chromosome segregation ATPase